MQLARLWQLSLAELAVPHLGSHLGRQWRPGRLHLYDYLFDTATTLGDALAVGHRYIGIINSAGPNETALIEEDDRVTIFHQPFQILDPDVQAAMSEFALSVSLHRVRQTLRREITPLHVGLATAAPASDAELTETFGTRSIDFGDDRTTMTFARSDLGLPMPCADPQLAAVLRQHAETVIGTPVTTPRWIDRFRQVLAAHLAKQALSLPAVAQRMGMSPRTLQRRLERDGTSWREEADSMRRDQAVRLLRDGVPRTAIAARLGYSDTRALRRAVHRWDTRSAHHDR
jgi:AraC-like DNA-binding protein